MAYIGNDMEAWNNAFAGQIGHSPSSLCVCCLLDHIRKDTTRRWQSRSSRSTTKWKRVNLCYCVSVCATCVCPGQMPPRSNAPPIR